MPLAIEACPCGEGTTTDATITARIPLDMTGGQPLFTDVVDTTYTSTELEIDMANYPGFVAGWVQVWAGSNATTGSVIIVDENGTVYATVPIPLNQPFVSRMALVSFTPTGSHRYYVKLPANAAINYPSGSTNVTIYGVRLYLDVENSSRVRLQIPLFTNAVFNVELYPSGNAATNDLRSYAARVNNSGSGFSNSGIRPPVWLKEAGRFSTVLGWEFETIAAMSSGQTGQIGLRQNDEFSGNMVADATVTETATVPTRQVKALTDATTDFGYGDNFRVQCAYHSATGSNRLRVYRVALYVTIDNSGGSIKADIFERIGDVERINFTVFETLAVGVHTLVDTSKYQPGTTWHHESTGHNNGAGSFTMQIWKIPGDYQTIGIPSSDPVPGSVLDYTSPTTGAVLTRQRGGPLTMTTQERYMAVTQQDTIVNNNIRFSNTSFLIHRVES